MDITTARLPAAFAVALVATLSPQLASAQLNCQPSLSLAISDDATAEDILVSSDGSVAAQLVLRNIPDDAEVTAKALRGTSTGGTQVAGETTIIRDETSRLLVFRPLGVMGGGQFTLSAEASLPDGSTVSDSLTFRVVSQASGDTIDLGNLRMVDLGSVPSSQNCCATEERCQEDACGVTTCSTMQCWASNSQPAQRLDAVWIGSSFGRIAELYRTDGKTDDETKDELVARYVNWGEALETRATFFGELAERCVRLKVRRLLDDETIYNQIVCQDSVEANSSSSIIGSSPNLGLCSADPDDAQDPIWLNFIDDDIDTTPVLPERSDASCSASSPSTPAPLTGATWLLLAGCLALRRRP